ncbi:MAG: hypothetical protein IKR69_05190 [Bacteroidales bacterium]|nr:hypothetical protein [Bacteroidales bacterium]
MSNAVKNNGIDPDFLAKQKESLRRKHRQVIYLNDNELDAIRQFCERYPARRKAAFLREAIMERVLSGLDEGHPTLF